ncbi:hypothetical protein SprV_0200559500 [Sparganum proliferum]
MADEILDRLVQAIEKLSSNGDQLPKPQKLTMYDDYDLWEDRMKLYLESVSEGNRSLAILGQLDSDVYAVARAANITSSLTTATIFERLRREFGRSPMPWVARAALRERRQHSGESVVDFQRHLRVLAKQAYPDDSCSALEDRILDNFVDGIANLDIRRKFMLDPPKTLKAALDSARDEEVIYAALSPSPGPSSSVPSGPRFQTAPPQSQMVNVFAMGPRPTCDIGTQTARWQWDPQPQSTPRYDHQRSTPRRGNWRDQRGRWTRPQYRPGVHTITAGEEEESGFPNELVGVDIIGPIAPSVRGNRYILVMVDFFTKMAEVEPLPNMSADTVAQAIFNGWDRERPFATEITVHFNRLKLGERPDAYGPEDQGNIVCDVDRDQVGRIVEIPPEGGDEFEVPFSDRRHNLEDNRSMLHDTSQNEGTAIAEDSDVSMEEGVMPVTNWWQRWDCAMADEILDRLVQAIEKLSSNGDQLPKPQKLTMYDDYDLWEDRMKLYLESVSEGNRSLAILGQLDSDVYAVARAANITSSLTTATIFERLRREFGRSPMPWVARAALRERRQHSGESVVDFQRHLRVLAKQAYPDDSCSALEDRILDNFVDGIANLDIRRKFMLDPPKTLKAALDSARDEEVIYAALSPSPGPSSSVPSGPRFQTAPPQSQMVNVFAMGPRPTCDIGTQTARWQWDPQPQSTPRYDHQRSTPRRGNWRDQRGRWTRPQYRPGVHTITAGEEEESGFPNELVGVDIIGPIAPSVRGNRYILVMVDFFTKMAEVEPLPNMSADTVAQAIFNGWDRERPFATEITVHFNRLKLGERPDAYGPEDQGNIVCDVDRDQVGRIVEIPPEGGDEFEVPFSDRRHNLEDNRSMLHDTSQNEGTAIAEDSDVSMEEGVMPVTNWWQRWDCAMADEILDRLVQAIEKLSSNGDQLPKPQKLTMYDDYDLWEDRMKLYLESVSEGNRSLAILGQLDSDVYAVARAANITSSLTTATIFERLRREFGRSPMPWVARAALRERRQHSGESVVDFQRHLRVLAKQAYPDDSCSALEDRILDNFVDGIANLDIRRKFMLDPPKTLKAALDSARDEEVIYAALSPSPGPSSSVPSGPRFQTAPPQSQMVNVFAMGPRPTCDIGTQTARWQWDPQPQSTPRYDHQRSTPRRGNWRDQRGRWTRPQYRPGVHTITAGEEEESGFPNELVGVDIIGPIAPSVRGNRYILVMVDFFTKMAEVEPLPNMSADTVAQAIFNGWDRERPFATEITVHFNRLKLGERPDAYGPEDQGNIVCDVDRDQVGRIVEIPPEGGDEFEVPFSDRRHNLEDNRSMLHDTSQNEGTAIAEDSDVSMEEGVM